MGMHFGVIAVKAAVHELIGAFAETWPNWERRAIVEGITGLAEFDRWREANERFVSAVEWSPDNPGIQAFAFWQDGPWAMMLDGSYVLAADEKALSELSKRWGCTLSFVVESAGGCAFFWAFQSGSLRRSILNTGETVAIEGVPLDEEAGIDVKAYYMDETERLQRAFGITPLSELPEAHPMAALSVADRNDYAKPRTALGGESNASLGIGPSREKPWWKVW